MLSLELLLRLRCPVAFSGAPRHTLNLRPGQKPTFPAHPSLPHLQSSPGHRALTDHTRRGRGPALHSIFFDGIQSGEGDFPLSPNSLLEQVRTSLRPRLLDQGGAWPRVTCLGLRLQGPGVSSFRGGLLGQQWPHRPECWWPLPIILCRHNAPHFPANSRVPKVSLISTILAVSSLDSKV